MSGNGNPTISLDEFARLVPGLLYQLERNPEGVFRYRYISPAVERMFGVTVAEALANVDSLLGLIHPEDIDRVIEESMDTGRGQRTWIGEFRMYTRDGRLIWLEAVDQPRIEADGTIVWTGYAHDVSAKKALEQKILDLARFDALTGLLNRQAFLDLVENALRPARRERDRFALFFVDLDGFKPVNDSHGHATGDLLLQAVAARLRATLRESDTVGRYGGDEFVVLLPALPNNGDVLAVARKVNEALAAPFELRTATFRISASIGIAFFPEHAGGAEALIACADQAMYQSKNARPGGFRVYGRGKGDR